jgi:hypothetical protein
MMRSQDEEKPEYEKKLEEEGEPDDELKQERWKKRRRQTIRRSH